MLCYANADLRKGEESDEVLRFVDFWTKTYGKVPRTSCSTRSSPPTRI
ncbi:hypothetical protein WMF18_31730 [Sorangium sp. So ce315]